MKNKLHVSERQLLGELTDCIWKVTGSNHIRTYVSGKELSTHISHGVWEHGSTSFEARRVWSLSLYDRSKTWRQTNFDAIKIMQGRRRRGGRGGTCLPTFKSGGGHKWVCAPPLLGRANVLISLFAHILWLKTQFFQNFLGSLRSPTLINQYFLNFANLKL